MVLCGGVLGADMATNSASTESVFKRKGGSKFLN